MPPDVFLPPDVLIKSYQAPKELNMFILETECRKMIQELMLPLIEDMDIDRRQAISIKLHMDRVDSRLLNLEQITGLEGEKPKIF